MADNNSQVIKVDAAMLRKAYIDLWESRLRLLKDYHEITLNVNDPATPRNIAEMELQYAENIAPTVSMLLAVGMDIRTERPESIIIPSNIPNTKPIMLGEDQLFVKRMVEIREQLAQMKTHSSRDPAILSDTLYDKFTRTRGKLELSIQAKDIEGIMRECLAKHGGFWVADAHDRLESKLLTTKSIQLMSSLGGGVYCGEAPDIIRLCFANEIDRKNILQNLDRPIVAYGFSNSLQNMYKLSEESANKIAQGYLDTFREAAKSDNVMYAAYEKPVQTMSDELVLLGAEHRIATTNFTWPMQVNMARGGASGKPMIGMCGATHLIDDVTMTARGLVDDITRKPVICLTKGREGSEPIVKGNIIFIAAGEDYPDLMSQAKESTFEVIKPVQPNELRVAPPNTNAPTKSAK